MYDETCFPLLEKTNLIDLNAYGISEESVEQFMVLCELDFITD
jgi:hypothetical protein